MATEVQNISKYFSLKRVAIPIVIGLTVAIYLLVSDFDLEAFMKIELGFRFFGFLALAILFLAMRDFFYIVRLRILSDNKISWRHAFQVIMLWEFTSAITPSVVGGSAVAMFIIHRERISLGRSTAIVMITAIMDELFYILAVPITILIAGSHTVFPDAAFNISGISLRTQEVFWIGYVFIAILIFFLVIGVFISPRGFKNMIVGIFKIRFLRKWQEKSVHFGDEVILTSEQLKGKHFSFWFSTFGVTILSWTSRFLVVNALIAAFQSTTIIQHTEVFGRQLIMWVILMISPTPGGSGVAEYFFPVFLSDYIPLGIASTLAFVWRFLTYYPYLFVGIIVFPLWLKRVMKHHRDGHKH